MSVFQPVSGKRQVVIKSLRWLLLLVCSVALLPLLNSCATFSEGLTGAVQSFDRGDFKSAEALIKSSLSPTGQDRLLYHLELGVVKHLDGDYLASNELLSKAEDIAQKLQTVSVTGQLGVLMSNPRQGPYRGADHEKVLINYYKALNFLGLAQQSEGRDQRLDNLEGARIEARRMLIRLKDIRYQKGDYSDIKTKDEEKSTFASILGVLSGLSNSLDEDKLAYRDDAFAHYLIGLTFEMNREFDNARISYESAAKSYEQGYQEQYRLEPGMASQAWMDTLRMMRLSGNFESEWPRLAEQKLNDEQRRELDQQIADYDSSAEVILIEHKGRVPEAKEVSIDLRASKISRSLMLNPDCHNRSDACAWFYNLYADKGLFKVGVGILDGVLEPEFFSPYTKTVWLGPVWGAFSDLGMNGILGGWMRVTAPYYAPVKKLPESSLTVNGKTLALLEAASPAQLAVQQAMLSADEELKASIARTVVKQMLVKTVSGVVEKSDKDKGPLLGLAVGVLGSIAAAATEAAETRSWILLPQDIRLRRVRLAAGESELTLASRFTNRGTETIQRRVNLKAGEMLLWQARSMPGAVQPAGKAQRQLPVQTGPEQTGSEQNNSGQR